MSTEPADGACQVCDMRTNADKDAVVYTDELWTVALGWDVPGWYMVMVNRHGGDWLWGLSDTEAAALGPLIRNVGQAAKTEAAAECVYMMGFGEQWQHFHFMLMSRPASTATEFRGAGILAHAAELADRDEAVRVGARVRQRLA